jgi:hypothetical protein
MRFDVRLLIFVAIGQDWTFEAGNICGSLVQKLIDVVLIEHSMFCLKLIDFHTAFVVVLTAVGLVVEMRFPLSEVILCGGYFVVFLGGGFGGEVLVLGSLYQSGGIPGR